MVDEPSACSTVTGNVAGAAPDSSSVVSAAPVVVAGLAVFDPCDGVSSPLHPATATMVATTTMPTNRAADLCTFPPLE